MEENILLDMQGIEKKFAHSYALKSVDFSIRKGEVHALMGENGAGKSTLIKVLTGVYPKDNGTIFFNGKEVEINTRSDAAKLGIGVIYQELSLIPTLSVTQNIMIGKEKHFGGVLAVSAMRKEVKRLIDLYEFDMSPDDIVETLSLAQQQMVEILKALSENAYMIIMDEPTASLSTKESEILFTIIDQLKEKGISVLYISHRLEEVFRLSDRITVLRDGSKVGVLNKDEIIPAEVVKMMIGKELSEASASRPLSTSTKEPVLELQNLTRAGHFSNVNLTVHAGEVLVLSGLVGAGRTEVLRCIFGADHYDSGKILYRGNPMKKGIKTSIRNGFGFIPEDRRTQGYSPLVSIARNIAVTNYDKVSKHSFVQSKKENQLGMDTVKAIDIRPANHLVPAGTLSGGNQQKVVLGKWLTRDLNVILIDEPTVGIDVGAKNEIYKIIDGLAAKGVAVLLVSSDLAEVLRVAHRIVILRKGKVYKEFNQGVVTQEDILLASSGIDHTPVEGGMTDE